MFFNRLYPTSNWCTKHFSFGRNLELQGGPALKSDDLESTLLYQSFPNLKILADLLLKLYKLQWQICKEFLIWLTFI